MEEHKSLAEFQSALLELLSSPLAPEDMLRRLHSDPAFAPYQQYTATFELRMVEVAAVLVKKWARRRDEISALDANDLAPR